MTTAELNIRVQRRKYFETGFRVIIISALLYYLYFNLNIKSIYGGALKADFFLLLFSLLLLPVNIFFQYFKWKTSCGYLLGVSDKRKIWRSLFAGFSAAIFTPARIGEYFGRGLEFPDNTPLEITSAVFIDKLFTYLFVVLFGIPGAFVFFDPGTAVIFTVIVLSSLILIYTAGRGVANSRLIQFIRKIRFIGTAAEKIQNLKKPDRNFSVKMLIYSFGFYLCFNIQFVLLFAAFMHGENTGLFFAAAGIVMFVKTMIPNFISGDVGIRESAAVFFMNLAGKDPNAAFNASIFLFLINIAIPSAIGIIPLLRNKR